MQPSIRKPLPPIPNTVQNTVQIEKKKDIPKTISENENTIYKLGTYRIMRMGESWTGKYVERTTKTLTSTNWDYKTNSAYYTTDITSTGGYHPTGRHSDVEGACLKLYEGCPFKEDGEVAVFFKFRWIYLSNKDYKAWHIEPRSKNPFLNPSIILDVLGLETEQLKVHCLSPLSEYVEQHGENTLYYDDPESNKFYFLEVKNKQIQSISTSKEKYDCGISSNYAITFGNVNINDRPFDYHGDVYKGYLTKGLPVKILSDYDYQQRVKNVLIKVKKGWKENKIVQNEKIVDKQLVKNTIPKNVPWSFNKMFSSPQEDNE